jgi:hypothetical protein
MLNLGEFFLPDFEQLVGFLGRWVGSLQGLCLQRETQHRRGRTSMPRVEFEPTTPDFERLIPETTQPLCSVPYHAITQIIKIVYLHWVQISCLHCDESLRSEGVWGRWRKAPRIPHHCTRLRGVAESYSSPIAVGTVTGANLKF